MPGLQISDFFTSDELIPPGMRPTVVQFDNIVNLVKNVLHPFRVMTGKRVTINDDHHHARGLRSLEQNAACGGAVHSQHLLGEAADCVVEDMSPYDVCAALAGSGIDFDQIIEEDGWTHMSFTTRHKPRREILTKQGNEYFRWENGKKPNA